MIPTYLVFDTETTGLPVRSARGEPPVPADDPRQPRVLSFAAIVANADGHEISRDKIYVRPEGFTVAECDARAIADGKRPASEINGLNDDFLNEYGHPIGAVLDIWNQAIDGGLIPVAFNAQFDTKMMRGELRSAGMPDRFEETPNICAMKALWPYRAEGLDVKSGGFVSLAIACEYFGIVNENAHDAMADAEAARAILERLIRDDRLPNPTLRTAKNHGATL
ncbi:hypothetical protein AN189_07435 [Loktanella sp. 3ANDIMAR09]|uniref:3'-5' exonuclease n=1 Tax=Loktanella sp. 3ANDIMAR09 TaxID=1225657 RepID=UPI0007006B1F|nr:exonuclease domain-containing protein [Loktanella sp. 3ANDIMAR09]KQI68722.1 hypothetical protein AN189_07435 [Loktanella sp. 3ANDIMAR09]